MFGNSCKSVIVFTSIFIVLTIFSCLAFAGGNLLQIRTGEPTAHDSVIWQNSQLPIRWYLSSDGLQGFSNVELQAAIQAAFDTWGQIATSTIAFEYGGEIDERLSGIDGKNLITFTDHDYEFQADELAFAITYTFVNETVVDDTNNDLDGDGTPDIPNGTYPAGSIYEADIVFNASHALENSGANSTVDIQAVALHEIGHVFGLSHTVVDDAVMYPFLSTDIASARLLKTDDIAFASYLYPNNPAYDAAFGSISGLITNGYGGQPVLGAHVYAVDPVTGKKTVGAFSLEQGDYLVPGLSPGNYYIGIEPLDGEPRAADPKRINQVIENTFDTNFVEELYDSNESNIETDPQNAQTVSVVAGNAVAGINLITNTVDVPGVGVLLRAGLNLFSYPVETTLGFTAFDLLAALGNSTEINSIDRYNTESGRFERAHWVNDAPGGVNFSIKRGEGYLVHMKVQKTVTFKGQQNCPLIDVEAGFNLIGVPCPPAGYGAYDLLQSIGAGVVSVKRYDAETLSYEEAYLDTDGSSPAGTDFPVSNGTAYAVETLAGTTGVSLPGLEQVFPPYVHGLSPGRGVIGTRVVITGQGFSDNPVQNDVLFNGTRAAVNYASGDQLVVTVPGPATSGPVSVVVGGKTSNTIDFIVEPLLTTENDLQDKDMVDGQTVEGTLDSNSEQDRYSFIATKGSSVTATALSVSPGVPDLLLFLEGPSGEVLASDDNSGGGSDAKITRFDVARTGRYTLVVTAKPASGSGAYTLKLDIENVPPVPEISILNGDFQTGVTGSVLPNALEVLVTGPTGAPMAGVPVSLVTNDDVIVSGGFTAATYQVLTNSSGIVSVSMTLPVTLGQFDIVVDVPGYAPKTIKAATVSSLPTQVVVVNNNQDCGGTGCPVGQPLPAPYILRYLDINSQPVQGVLTKFTIASGNGLLVSTPDTAELSATSDVNGEVSITHRLGNRVYDARTGNRIPQIVAVTGSHPGTELVLLESAATADTAAKVQSLKTNAIRITMGTAILNGIHIKVTDQYGNPVPNAQVSYSADGGLELAPGILDGEEFTAMATNDRGEFVGMIKADYQSAEYTLVRDDNIYEVPLGGFPYTPPVAGEILKLGTVGVTPTIDEYGARVPGASPYRINVNVDTYSLGYDIEVDMGPVLVITTVGTLSPNEGQWVGKDFSKSLVMQVFTYQRTDDCQDTSPADKKDDDNGDWRNEDFSISRIRKDNYFGIAHTITADRVDANPDTVLLDSTWDDHIFPPIDPSESVTVIPDSQTPITTAMEVKVTSDVAHGAFNVHYQTEEKTGLYFSPDDVCISGPTIYILGRHDFLAYFDYEWSIPRLSNDMPLQAVSPRIEVAVSDQSLNEPVPDPLPTIPSNSGISLKDLNISLNTNTVFDGTAGSINIGQYPNYVQLIADNASMSTYDSGLIQSISPGEFRFVYYPTSAELDLLGTNTIDVTGLKDKVGNATPDSQQLFTLP